MDDESDESDESDGARPAQRARLARGGNLAGEKPRLLKRPSRDMSLNANDFKASPCSARACLIR